MGLPQAHWMGDFMGLRKPLESSAFAWGGVGMIRSWGDVASYNLGPVNFGWTQSGADSQTNPC